MKPLIILLFLLFLLSSTIISQTPDDFICAPVTEDPNSNFSITGGKYKPSKNGEGEYLRVLVVFVQFEGDNSAADDWLPNEFPGWAYSFLDPNPSVEYTDKTSSDYWNEMALGNFDVIGTVFPDLITLPPESTYANASENFSHTNLDAIEIIDNWNPSQGPGPGGWNWSPYDNWEYDPGTQTFVFNPGNADGYIDMIFMIYRNATFQRDTLEKPGTWFGGGWGAFGGAATLGKIPFEFITNDDLIVSSGNGWISAEGSGITFRTGGPGGKRGTLGLMAHEYGHYLFEAGHPNYSGIMGGNTYAMNGWERIRVDQIQPILASGNGNEYILGDFIETGNVLKIPIPINNPNSTTYFLVENHQRTSSYDHIVRGGSINGGYDYTGLGKGIYVYLIKNGNNYPGVNFEMLVADGYFDWTYVGDFWAGPGWNVGKPYEGWLPKTTRIAVNRNTGKNDRMPKHLYWNNHWAVKWVDTNPLTKEWELTRDIMGDLTDAFNIGYNEFITNWSNPSSYVTGYGQTNISIQLVDENAGVFTSKSFQQKHQH